jgi:redox-sensing transcriptional repressor
VRLVFVLFQQVEILSNVAMHHRTPAPPLDSAVTPAGTPSPEAVRKAGIAAVKRLPAYLQMLRVLQGEGHEYVSGTVLAQTHNLEPVIVRKDLALTGVVGKARIGFQVPELIRAIEKFLGWDSQTKAVLVGVGNLGSALLGYTGFENFGLRIAGAFDTDPAKVGKWVQGRKVQSLDRLTSFARRGGISLGVLTVSGPAAQAAADRLVQAGIRGIWNFTPVKLVLPPEVVEQREDLAQGLAVLSRRLHQFTPLH